MSSRLMPPKIGAMLTTVSTIASTSWVARQIGNASTLPNSLKSIDLPSITGIAASGPMLPRPSTALPSLTIATEFRLIVRFRQAQKVSRLMDPVVRCEGNHHRLDRLRRSVGDEAAADHRRLAHRDRHHASSTRA